VNLFRVFDWDGRSLAGQRGGPLFVPRDRQGSGRHDAPALYGAWYCSRDAVSAVAESIKFVRGQHLSDGDFRRGADSVQAIVELRLDAGAAIIDLDDPRELVRRRTRPSQVATLRRAVTQRIAAAVFKEGATGFGWWSTLEAEWANVTLFHERALPLVSIAVPPRSLTVKLSEVRQAARHLGIDV
jgi:hypothetical protein